MSPLRDAHGQARFRYRDRQARVHENLLEGGYRSTAAMVHHGARPVEDDRGQLLATAHIHSFAVRSARPNDKVMPEPPGAVTMRTPGSGSAWKTGSSGWIEYTPCQRSAMDQSGIWTKDAACRIISSSMRVLLKTSKS